MNKFLVSVFLLIANVSFAQAPSGYYSAMDGKTGEDLRLALFDIIRGHTSASYDDLWTHFEATDVDANGKVWDIYSNNPNGSSSYVYSFGTDQCGQYSGEGDCYNREHIIPQDWFNGNYPMYTDLFNLYPTDGFVNGKRSNLPYGEVGNATWVSQNGSKLGNCNYPGYSNTVFEPIDEFKGDLARSYFYMITRYQNVSHSWSSAIMNGKVFDPWFMKMIYDWHIQDTVSQKEIDRNNAIYQIQGNRNPYIDYAWLVDYAWDDLVGVENINEEENQVVINNLGVWLKHPGEINLYDLTGKLIGSYSTTHLDYPSLDPGVYIVSVLSQNKVVSKKIALH